MKTVLTIAILFVPAMMSEGCSQTTPAVQTASATASVNRPTTQPQAVRCVVIGGMMETGFWDALAKRFEVDTGIPVEVVASGNKAEITPFFAAGRADLITMHSSDAIVNLVADGYAMDLQPWARNDMLIVGPAADPAHIKGTTDAAKALRVIAETKSDFLVHSSLGAQEVMRAILDAEHIQLDPEHTQVLFNDRSRQVLGIASERKAYTMVGRIPFLDHKLPNDGLEVMTQGDPRLRRPFLVAVANPVRFPAANVVCARRLAAYLREPATQQWIAEFGKGMLDANSLFFPVETMTARPGAH